LKRHFRGDFENELIAESKKNTKKTTPTKNGRQILNEGEHEHEAKTPNDFARRDPASAQHTVDDGVN
jgi:hypothetical protein